MHAVCQRDVNANPKLPESCGTSCGARVEDFWIILNRFTSNGRPGFKLAVISHLASQSLHTLRFHGLSSSSERCANMQSQAYNMHHTCFTVASRLCSKCLASRGLYSVLRGPCEGVPTHQEMKVLSADPEFGGGLSHVPPFRHKHFSQLVTRDETLSPCPLLSNYYRRERIRSDGGAFVCKGQRMN